MIRVSLRCAVALAIGCIAAISSHAQDGQTSFESFVQTGQQALAAGDYAGARSNFEQAEKLEPAVAEVHATLAAIYFKQHQFEAAVTEVKAAQKLKPGLPRLDSLLGLSLSELGRFNEARPKLEKGFKQTADPMTRRMCGLQLLRTYAGLDRDADAVATALELNRLYPDDPEILYHTGRVYGNYAYVVMEKLHDKAPNSIWMLQAQGEANESQKNYDAAIDAFNHVLAIDPQRPGIHYRLGRVYLRRFEGARRPEDKEAARHEFGAELQVDPANGNAAYELAQMAADDNDLADARKRFEAIVDRFPDFEQALVGLGGVELEAQQPADAVAALGRATKLDPNDEVAWYRLAQAQRASGNRDDAQRALEQFRRLHDAATATLKPPTGDEITAQRLGPDAQ